MEVKKQTQLKPWGSVGKLAIPIGIGLLLIFIWIFAAHGVFPARAATSTLYVDKASGSNGGMNNCQDINNPCLTIQYALNQAGQAGNDDIIQVAEGTYSGTINIAITVTLKGGYDAADWSRDIDTHITKIDANGAAAPVFLITPNSDFTIEGFTIEGSENSAGTGGGFLINDATVLISATIVQDNEADNGGGVWVEGDNADVWIQNSSLLNNRAENNGGGLHNSGWGKVTLINSLVQGNDAPLGGGGIQANTITITETQIVSNTSASSGAGINGYHALIYKSKIGNNTVTGGDHTYGGGIAISNGSLYLENSDIFNNSAVSTGTLGVSGGSALVVNQADTTILNTVISDNKDGGNTVAVFSSPFTITNVMILNNDGDGISTDDVPITGTLMNVTVAGNGGQGIYMNEEPDTNVAITNSILWDNGAIDNNCGTSCTITYSIIGTGDTSGEGNLSANPQFVDPASG
ncbi:MAG: right-handed parallel beta-helix repeat-containing protein, partial [Anaerolineales bacterium]|nr:right-handed parallel beta-helix repeat-containing protein [Anaerolineales bacterium]